MEQKMENKAISTKDGAAAGTPVRGVFLSPKDAEEYRLYRRQKKLGEIAAAISVSESPLLGNEDIQRVCERAARLKQAAVKLPLSKMTQAAYYLAGSRVGLDCVIGGTGETLAKVKAYEARQAVKRKAREITVPVTPSLMDGCRYGEIKKELRRVSRAAKKANLKVRVENVLSATALSRVARLACEVGAKYFSVPYFKGCERLKLDLTNGCKLEVSGVEKTEDFKRLIEAGVGRIVTDRAWEIYTEWSKEADEETLSLFTQPEQKETPKSLPAPVQTAEEKTPALPAPSISGGDTPPRVSGGSFASKGGSETEYRCRLEGKELKFF